MSLDLKRVCDTLESLPRIDYAELIGNMKIIAELSEYVAEATAQMKVLKTLDQETAALVQSRINEAMATLKALAAKSSTTKTTK